MVVKYTQQAMETNMFGLSTWQSVLKRWVEQNLSSIVLPSKTENILNAVNVTAGFAHVLFSLRYGELAGIETLLPALVEAGAEFRDEHTVKGWGLLNMACRFSYGSTAVPNFAALRAIIRYCTPKATERQDIPCDLNCSRCVCLSCALWVTNNRAVRDWLLEEWEATCNEDLIRYYCNNFDYLSFDFRLSSLRSLIPHVLTGRLTLNHNWQTWPLLQDKDGQIHNLLTELAASQTRRENEMANILSLCLKGANVLVHLVHFYLVDEDGTLMQ